MCARFAHAMKKFYHASDDVDSYHDELVKHVRVNACKVFGRPVAKPIKPWISPRTWSYLKHGSQLRLVQFKCSRFIRRCKLHIIVHAWRRVLSLSYVTTCSSQVYQKMCVSQQAHAVLRRCTDLLHFVAGPLTREDKELYVNNLAFNAQRHGHSGNIRGTPGIIEALTKQRTRPPPAVKLIDGTIVADEIQRRERWLEHFCSLYNGRMFKDVALLGAPRESQLCGQMCVSSCHVDWSASN